MGCPPPKEPSRVLCLKTPGLVLAPLPGGVSRSSNSGKSDALTLKPPNVGSIADPQRVTKLTNEHTVASYGDSQLSKEQIIWLRGDPKFGQSAPPNNENKLNANKG